MNLIRLIALFGTGLGQILLVIFILMCICNNIDILMYVLAFIFWIVVIGGAIVSFISMFK